MTEGQTLRPGPGRPRRAGADDAILDAALELFAEHGVEGVSIEQIARRAGVTRATIYRRWKTKEALLAQALGRAREGESAAQTDWGAVDADELVRVMTEETPEVLARPDFEKLVARLLGSAHAHPELLAAYWDNYLAPRRAAFAHSLDAMRAAGRLETNADSDIIQDMLAGALIYRFLVRPGPHSAEERQDYCRRLLAAIGVRGPAPDQRTG